MNSLSIYEFSLLTDKVNPICSFEKNIYAVSSDIFKWLEKLCLSLVTNEKPQWLRLTQYNGYKCIQVTSYVGIILAPNGFQIEVLPKIGRVTEDTCKVRQLLIKMLCCLQQFRHIKMNRALITAAKMPLLEVFIHEFLICTSAVVKRGLRSNYITYQDNLFILHGKIVTSSHLTKNITRKDRFFCEFDEFSIDRPENRLIHTALKYVLKKTHNTTNKKLAYELCTAFSDVPISTNIMQDFRKVSLERDMLHYKEVLAWCDILLNKNAPLTGINKHYASSLLFPMESVFEGFVTKQLKNKVKIPYVLQPQVHSCHLVKHKQQNWFKLQPDMLIKENITNKLVLDTKWKLLNINKADKHAKYGLSQSDFYQLYAYGQNYLKGQGEIILIYPKTDNFNKPLEVFEFHFPTNSNLKLWVIPFCIESCSLVTENETITIYFKN